MRGGRFTVGVLLLCLAAAIWLPQLKDMRLLFWQSFLSAHQEQLFWPAKDKIAAIVSRSPNDVYLHIAQAQIAGSQESTQGGPSEAAGADFQALAERFPHSPAAQLQSAQRLLNNLGPDQRKEAWGSEAQTPPPSYRPRSPQEEKNLAEAISQLRLAAQLDPQNAAPQYFLAYALLQRHEDSSAQAALREAMTRHQWSAYSRETRAALFELFEKSGTATVYQPIQVLAVDAWASGAKSQMRDLARILSARAEQDRLQGNQTQALFYYTALIHLGGILLDQADSLLDGLVARAVIDLTSVHFITPAEKAALKTPHLTREAQIARMRNIRYLHFRDYLLSRQRGDLANQYVRNAQRGEILQEKAQSVPDKTLAMTMQAFDSRYLIGGFMFLGYAVAALGLWLLAGLIASLTGTFKTDAQAPGWRWREWSALLLVILGLGSVVIWLYPLDFTGESFHWFPFGEIIALAILLLLLLFPLVGGWRKTRQEPPRPAKARLAGVLNSYRILMPPAFAVMLAVALVCFSLTESHMARWAAQEKQMVLQGEVRSWQLLPK